MAKYMPRHKKARDVNEPDVVTALKAKNFKVIRIDTPADLLIQCLHGQWLLLEVKNPDGGRLTREQLDMNQSLHKPIPLVYFPKQAQAYAEKWCANHPSTEKTKRPLL